VWNHGRLQALDARGTEALERWGRRELLGTGASTALPLSLLASPPQDVRSVRKALALLAELHSRLADARGVSEGQWEFTRAASSLLGHADATLASSAAAALAMVVDAPSLQPAARPRPFAAACGGPGPRRGAVCGLHAGRVIWTALRTSRLIREALQVCSRLERLLLLCAASEGRGGRPRTAAPGKAGDPSRDEHNGSSDLDAFGELVSGRGPLPLPLPLSLSLSFYLSLCLYLSLSLPLYTHTHIEQCPRHRAHASVERAEPCKR
jgi:hypothetical protein